MCPKMEKDQEESSINIPRLLKLQDTLNLLGWGKVPGLYLANIHLKLLT